MKKKSFPKDLTQLIELATAGLALAAAVIELLGKVVNYGIGVRELRLQL